MRTHNHDFKEVDLMSFSNLSLITVRLMRMNMWPRKEVGLPKRCKDSNQAMLFVLVVIFFHISQQVEQHLHLNREDRVVFDRSPQWE